MVTSGLHRRAVFQGRKLLKLRDVSIRISPELTRSVVAEDGESINCELDRSLATDDGVNMQMEEFGAKKTGHDSFSTTMNLTRYKELPNRTRNRTSDAVFRT